MKHLFARLADGTLLEYAELGETRAGVPLLLLRPLAGTIDLWHDLATQLAARHRVIMFNARGVGDSSRVPLLNTTRTMARDAVALLDFLHIERAHVIGLSLGGMVATRLAIDAPNRVDHLVLLSTLPNAESISSRIRRHALPLVSAFFGPAQDVEARLLRDILSVHFKRTHAQRARAFMTLLRNQANSRRNLLVLSLAAVRHDASHDLHRILSPTLLAFGGDDPIAGNRARIELQHGIEDAVVEILPDAGHDLSLEKPNELGLEIQRFLRTTALASRARMHMSEASH